MQALIGVKKEQAQRFLENGMRIPVTVIDVKDNRVVAIKTKDRDHYQAVQLGFSMKKKATKAEVGHAKGAKLEKAPKFLREIRVIDEVELPEVGSILNPTEIFQPGDVVNVSGVSKGKGFAGGVKRWGFHGGPKTHGQSDRHRAPGSIGQGTTPGRVYKGKKMAGNMGNDSVTIRNLKVVDVTNDGVLVVKGLIPGVIKGLIMINKVGEDKKFTPLFRDSEEIAVEQSDADEKAAKDSSETVSDSSENGQAPAVQDSGEKSNEGKQVEAIQTESSDSKEEKVEEVSNEETKKGNKDGK